MARRNIGFVVLGAACVTGCASTEPDDGAPTAAALSQPATDGILYFHGMSHLGLDPKAIRSAAGGREVLAPSLSDAELRGEPSKAAVDFIASHLASIVS